MFSTPGISYLVAALNSTMLFLLLKSQQPKHPLEVSSLHLSKYTEHILVLWSLASLLFSGSEESQWDSLTLLLKISQKKFDPRLPAAFRNGPSSGFSPYCKNYMTNFLKARAHRKSPQLHFTQKAPGIKNYYSR